jgi:hypothetical protein
VYGPGVPIKFAAHTLTAPIIVVPVSIIINIRSTAPVVETVCDSFYFLFFLKKVTSLS